MKTFIKRKHKYRRTNIALKPNPETQKNYQPEKNLPKYIYCYICLQPVTSEDDKITMNGSHQHTFVNPSNIEYTIACFKSAPGCVAIGSPTYEFTWFTNFAWQIALCGNCGEHLGWKYSSKESITFWGLIVNKITTLRK